MDSQIISLNEELQDIRNKYNELIEGNASTNHMSDDTPMCERHEANYIQYEDNKDRNSYDSFSHQSPHDPNDPEKSLTELNNDVRKDLEDFKRCVRSMRTIHDKLYDRDDGKTTGVLPNKKSKTVNQEPQTKTDLEKSITKFLDGQRVTNMFLKMKQNEKNFQTKIKNMERKIDEWSKSQNVSLKQTDRTDPPPPQAHTEHVNAVFTAYEERVKEEDKANNPQENLLYARTKYSNENGDSSDGRGRGSYSRGRGRGCGQGRVDANERYRTKISDESRIVNFRNEGEEGGVSSIRHIT
ncbi:hypothetical protein Tco_0485378 [Tanacetum coccineum]